MSQKSGYVIPFSAFNLSASEVEVDNVVIDEAIKSAILLDTETKLVHYKHHYHLDDVNKLII